MVASAVIKSLLSGEIVAGSRISGKLLDELLSEGLLIVIVRGSRKSYRASNVESLRQFLIDKDERYKQLTWRHLILGLRWSQKQEIQN